MSERPRWAWEELQPGDVIEAGDEWQNDNGHWHPLVVMAGACIEVRDGLRARRPHNITALQKERDEARAQGAKLSAELWARKPLEDRVALLAEELAQAREASQQLLQAITDNADQFAWASKTLEQQRDEAQAALKSAQRARDELQLQVDELRAGLMGVVSAEHVHSMLEDMLDQTEWVGQCLDSSTYEQMSCIQRTISVIAERVNDMGKEATSAND